MGSKYPFDDWLDGRVWLLRGGHIDFSCMPISMQSQLYLHARKQSLMVSTRVIDDQSVLMQAYPEQSTWKPNLAEVPWSKIKKAMANPR